MSLHIIASLLCICAFITGCSYNANSPKGNINPVEYSFNEETARKKIKAILSANGEIDEKYWYDDTAYQIVGYLSHVNRDDNNAWKALNIIFTRIDGDVAEGGLEQDIIYLLDTSTLPHDFWFSRLVVLKDFTYGDNYASLMKYEAESSRQQMKGWVAAYNYCKMEENGKIPKGKYNITGSVAGVKGSLKAVKKWEKMARHFERRLSTASSG